MVCRLCLKEKETTDFYSSNKTVCKECIKNRTKTNRIKKLEYYREYDRNRPNKKERTLQQKEYKSKMRIENPDKYDKIFHGARKNYRAKYKEKNFATSKLNSALRSGKIKRPETCSLCGKTCKPQAHHFDYSKPLEVVWVCVSCHAEIHNRIRKEKRSA